MSAGALLAAAPRVLTTVSASASAVAAVAATPEPSAVAGLCACAGGADPAAGRGLCAWAGSACAVSAASASPVPGTFFGGVFFLGVAKPPKRGFTRPRGNDRLVGAGADAPALVRDTDEHRTAQHTGATPGGYNREHKKGEDTIMHERQSQSVERAARLAEFQPAPCMSGAALTAHFVETTQTAKDCSWNVLHLKS